ncbi:hypothetical protein PRIPAC_80909, partial [Pristionchus pacificus]|uniref:G protein-coupled receptor n=1 Tax=Pristionchus pacificus TaxID=54126 RepID=A0A2A6BVN1_PRIPA
MPINDTDRYIISSGIIVFNIIGLFGNINVIYAHYRLPALRTRFGILLTLLCISQSICLMSEPITAIYSFSKIPVVFDIYSIRSTCFTFFMIGIFSHCTLTGLMTTISVDLFISVVFPLRHCQFHTPPYLLVLSIPTLIYGCSVITVANMTMDSEIVPICNIPLALKGLGSRFWYYGAFILCAVILVTYNGAIQSSTKIEKKAIRSISVLVIVFVVTRFLGTLSSNFLILIEVDTDTVELVQSYNVYIALVNYSTTFYICISRSAEYRRIFVYQITRFIGIRGDESRIGSS